jgi:hypothetical protein
MIVLDANILIRAVLGRRVRQLIEIYAGKGVRFFAPDIAFLRNFIEPVEPELYAAFDQEARQRLRGRDENDRPILASVLALAYPASAEDDDFFAAGVAVWITNRIEIFFRERVVSLESREEGQHRVKQFFQWASVAKAERKETNEVIFT